MHALRNRQPAQANEYRTTTGSLRRNRRGRRPEGIQSAPICHAKRSPTARTNPPTPGGRPIHGEVLSLRIACRGRGKPGARDARQKTGTCRSSAKTCGRAIPSRRKIALSCHLLQDFLLSQLRDFDLVGPRTLPIRQGKEEAIPNGTRPWIDLFAFSGLCIVRLWITVAWWRKAFQ